MTRKFGKSCMSALRRSALAALLAGAAMPTWAESLGDTLVAAYRHSALLDQNRAVLRAADEDVATAMAELRPILQWALSHDYNDMTGSIHFDHARSDRQHDAL